MLQFTFYVPPLRPSKRKIAAILSSVDDAIEKTQAVIDQVQVVKRSLMQELFTRGAAKAARAVQAEAEWRNSDERLDDLLPLRAMAASVPMTSNRKASAETVPHVSDYVGITWRTGAYGGKTSILPSCVSDAFCARIADEMAAKLSRHRAAGWVTLLVCEGV